MKSKILSNSLEENMNTHLGEFSNTSFMVFEAERAKAQR